jgi:hypothetical protein
MKSLLGIVLAAFVVTVSGCGSVTGISPTKSHTLSEFSGYTKVIVADFNNGSTCQEPEKVKVACKNFSDRIATQLKTDKTFEDVSREQTPGKAITISGTITRYEEGNAAMRLLVGCGAGSSYFDADVVFKDSESGNEIATLKVDKNSWGLGGGIAAGQTVEGYMDEAAKKLSKELKDIKGGKKVDVAKK